MLNLDRALSAQPNPETYDPGRLITADDLAERWSCSRSYIYLLLDAGLPSLKLGRSRRFRPADVDAWLTEHVAGAA